MTPAEFSDHPLLFTDRGLSSTPPGRQYLQAKQQFQTCYRLLQQSLDPAGLAVVDDLLAAQRRMDQAKVAACRDEQT